RSFSRFSAPHTCKKIISKTRRRILKRHSSEIARSSTREEIWPRSTRVKAITRVQRDICNPWWSRRRWGNDAKNEDCDLQPRNRVRRKHTPESATRRQRERHRVYVTRAVKLRS